MEEPAEKYLDLAEFETALQKEVKAAAARGRTPTLFYRGT